MMKNVISSEHMQRHNIEPYRFKVLGSRIAKKDDDNTQQDSTPVQNTQSVHVEQSVPAPYVDESVHVQHSKPLESDFIEELLNKTDELSSNIVKLQLKIESQEEEFEKRLADEIARAKSDGEKEGYEKALQELQLNYSAIESQFQRSISLLETEQKRFSDFLQKSEIELSDTAIEVAKEVLTKEIANSSTEVAISLSKALMKELKDATKLEIRVNRKNYEGAKEFFEEFENINITIDDAISEGGVILFSSVGNIDGTINTRLERIKQMMKE